MATLEFPKELEQEFQTIFGQTVSEVWSERHKPWTEQDDNSADQDYIVGQSGTVQVIKDGTVA